MNIPAADISRFQAMAASLKGSAVGDQVRAGYAMELLLARIAELEKALPDPQPAVEPAKVKS